jgi:hypothetical protein
MRAFFNAIVSFVKGDHMTTATEMPRSTSPRLGLMPHGVKILVTPEHLSEEGKRLVDSNGFITVNNDAFITSKASSGLGQR